MALKFIKFDKIFKIYCNLYKKRDIIIHANWMKYIIFCRGVCYGK